MHYRRPAACRPCRDLAQSLRRSCEVVACERDLCHERSLIRWISLHTRCTYNPQDHCDVATLQQLWRKQYRSRPLHFGVPLKLKTWFLSAVPGVSEEDVTELDWWDGRLMTRGGDTLRFYASPSQHAVGPVAKSKAGRAVESHAESSLDRVEEASVMGTKVCGVVGSSPSLPLPDTPRLALSAHCPASSLATPDIAIFHQKTSSHSTARRSSLDGRSSTGCRSTLPSST